MMLANKTIVVTGVSSGIGADVAKLARFHGAKVIGMDRNEASLSLDGFIQIDLGDPEAINRAIKQLPVQIDGLCNIAGVLISTKDKFAWRQDAFWYKKALPTR